MTLQRGFTLIELVVVITILGILAALALPRFVTLDSSAHAADLKALAGSMRSAASLARQIDGDLEQDPCGSLRLYISYMPPASAGFPPSIGVYASGC